VSLSKYKERNPIKTRNAHHSPAGFKVCLKKGGFTGKQQDTGTTVSKTTKTSKQISASSEVSSTFLKEHSGTRTLPQELAEILYFNSS